MSKQHKHYKEIMAWANGTKIEERNPNVDHLVDLYFNPIYTDNDWHVTNHPKWIDSFEYRVYDPLRGVKEAFEEGKDIWYFDEHKDEWVLINNSSPLEEKFIDENLKWTVDETVPVNHAVEKHGESGDMTSYYVSLLDKAREATINSILEKDNYFKYEDRLELRGEYVRHKESGREELITGFVDYRGKEEQLPWICMGFWRVNSKVLYEKYEFIDGSPCCKNNSEW